MKQILYVNRMRNPLYNKTTRENVLYNGPIYEQIDNELKIYNIDRKSAESILDNFIDECNFDNMYKQVYLIRQKDKEANVYILSILNKINNYYKYQHIKIERSIRIDGRRGNHFVINCNIRLHNCDTIEKVIDELNTNLDVTESIRYFKNKHLLFGFYYNF